MSRSEQSVLIDASWNDVLRWLPPDLDQMAKDEFGFRRRGSFKSAANLLRLALAYAVSDLSLRSTAAWLTTRGHGDISDVAVLGRLRRAQTFLARTLAPLLAMRVQPIPCPNVPYNVRMLDGTCVSSPGATGAEWRIHATFDAARGVVDRMELTTDKGGEHLERSDAQSGDLLVASKTKAAVPAKRSLGHSMLAPMGRRPHDAKSPPPTRRYRAKGAGGATVGSKGGRRPPLPKTSARSGRDPCPSSRRGPRWSRSACRRLGNQTCRR